LRDLDEAIRLDPDYVPIYAHRGQTHLALRDFAAAIADFTTLLRQTPDDVSALAYRGQAYRALRQYEPALADFRAALELESEAARIHNLIAWLFATCPE